ncbi:UNVERIFIED_CONTAM: hypothetical protein RMT77_005241 [Armadillidium vulgare]
MRFRFCWDCDCPDWILAEISNITKIIPNILKEITQHIAWDACGSSKLNLDYLLGLVNPKYNLDMKTVRAVVAAIRWIISNAAGAEVEPKVLRSELEQLGLTKEHSIIISEVYDTEKERLQDSLKQRTLQASENVLFGYEIKEEKFGDDSISFCHLELQGKLLEHEDGYFSEPFPDRKERTEAEKEETEKDEKGNHTKIALTHAMLDGLINELEEAFNHMEEIGK